jgi:hypothetical protein
LVFLLVSGEQTFTATFAIPNEGIEQMARRNDGACANPKQIRTDVDCRAARPKFDKDASSPAKISEVTGCGLYLFVTPDESNLNGQMIPNISTPRPGVIEPRDVTRVFKLSTVDESEVW